MPSAEEWDKVNGLNFAWGSTGVRYAKQEVPGVKRQKTLRLTAWRGECVNAQAVVWTGKEVKQLSCTPGELKDSRGNILPQEALSVGWVRYVMTDELNKDGKGACGHRPNHALYDSLLVADPIERTAEGKTLAARTAQPVWVKCRVPQTAAPGVYKGTLLISDGAQEVGRLPLEIKVTGRVLPAPAEWAYHLDCGKARLPWHATTRPRSGATPTWRPCAP